MNNAGVGDKVKVLDGDFKGCPGTVLSVDRANKTAKVQLRSSDKIKIITGNPEFNISLNELELEIDTTQVDNTDPMSLIQRLFNDE